MRLIRAFLTALLLSLFVSVAWAVPTTTDIEGEISAAENTCVSPAQFFQFEYFQLCSYSGGVDIAGVLAQPLPPERRNWMGPLDSGGFYEPGTLQSPRTQGGFSGSDPNDGKKNLPFTGQLVIEDFGTPGDPADDRISGTLILEAFERGVNTNDGWAVETWDSITHTIPATQVSSATANAFGGFDYVIGSEGYPFLITSAAGPFPSEAPSIISDSSIPPDFNAWEVSAGGNITLQPYQAPPLPAPPPHSVEIVTYAPGAAGGGNVEPNIGVRTSVVTENFTCESGDADSTPDMTNPDPPELPTLIDDCNPDPAIGAGSTWAVSGAEFDNLILSVSTNASNKVIAAEAFYVVEYKIAALFLNKQNGVDLPGSWVGGRLINISGQTGAEPDREKTPPNTPVTIDVLANDSGFTDPVTISLPGGGTSTNGGTVVINGANPGPQADIDVTYTPATNFEGEDTFDYEITDNLGANATVQVSVRVSEVIARDTTVSTGEGETVDIQVGALPGVRLGQTPVTITVTGPPSSGTTEVNGLTISYTPVSFPASDDFVYRIEDANGNSDSATIFINISTQLIPDAVDDTVTMEQDTSVIIDVLANDVAGSGDLSTHSITIPKQLIPAFDNIDEPRSPKAAVSGDAFVLDDNTVIYTPDPGVTGVHTFQYTLTDLGGQAGPDTSAPATVTVTVNPADPAETTSLPSDSSKALGPVSLLLALLLGLRRGRRRSLTILTLAVALVSVTMLPEPATAAAHDEAGGAATVDTEALEALPKPKRRIDEITVTARKKEENLQDVPLSITAFTADNLERAGIRNLDDVAAFTPGLTFSNVFGEFLPAPIIRGVAPTAISNELNVAVFIDGVFVAGREGINAAQLDLERIEVLKGPQSTKYGRNAFSGAINYVTARPGDELEGEVKINVGNYDRRDARLTISGPIVPDMLSGRIALGIEEWSGSYENTLSDVDIDGNQYKTLQTSLWFTPFDWLDVQWALFLSDDEIDDSARATVAANCEDRGQLQRSNDQPNSSIAPEDANGDNLDWSDGPRPLNFCGTLPSLADNKLAVNNQSTGEERELVRTSLDFEVDVGWGTVVSLTGYSKTSQSQTRNDSNQTTNGTVPFLYSSTSGENKVFQAELTTFSFGGDETTEWSQELRYSSPLENPVRFDVGLYWYDEEQNGGFVDFTGRVAGGTGERLPADFAGFPPGAGVIGDAIFGPRFVWTVDDLHGIDVNLNPFVNETESISVFGGLEFDLGERWTFEFGARYNWDTKRVSQTPFFASDGTQFGGIGPIEEDFEYWSGRTSVRFQISDDNMIYASIAKGTKTGGIDLLTGEVIIDGVEVDIIEPKSFEKEELFAYELGNKGTFWGSRAQYDIALFYNDWKDILIPQFFATTTLPDGVERPFVQPEAVDQTLGDGHTYGIETSITVLLADNWEVNLGGSWTEAEYDKTELATFSQFPSAWCDPGPGGRPADTVNATRPDGTPVPDSCYGGDGIGDAVNVDGKEVLRSAEWQGNATLNYRQPIGGGDWEFFSRSDLLYTGSQWGDAYNQTKIPANTTFNQRLGFERENLKIEFWIENLFDQDNPSGAFRDVTFNNTHILQDSPEVINRPEQEPYGGFSDIFPFRWSVSYPDRRTFGANLLIRF